MKLTFHLLDDGDPSAGIGPAYSVATVETTFVDEGNQDKMELELAKTLAEIFGCNCLTESEMEQERPGDET